MSRYVRTILLAALALVTPALTWAQTVTVEYYHLDAVGSVRAVTDQNGAVVRTHPSPPFGTGDGVAPGTDPLRYTGKERDPETGLDYFGARYYASRTGRFTTVDPVLNIDAALTDPQRWNRYAYAKNNPLVFIDPDGAEITTPAGFFTKAFAQQNADNLRALGKVLVNIGRSINSPGHMTPEAEMRHFEQPESREEANRMRLFDLMLSAAPLLGLRGGSAELTVPLGRGSTGRAIAGNLREQLALEQAMADPAAGQVLRNIRMADTRWPVAEGWVKMRQRINGIEIHYLRNTKTGAVDDFKFIGLEQ